MWKCELDGRKSAQKPLFLGSKGELSSPFMTYCELFKKIDKNPIAENSTYNILIIKLKILEYTFSGFPAKNPNLVGLGDHHAHIMTSTTTEAQYQNALSRFALNPQPDGVLLDWVCRDTLAALDLVNDRLAMNPT